jgi:hypothetical protein
MRYGSVRMAAPLVVLEKIVPNRPDRSKQREIMIQIRGRNIELWTIRNTEDCPKS